MVNFEITDYPVNLEISKIIYEIPDRYFHVNLIKFQVNKVFERHFICKQRGSCIIEPLAAKFFEEIIILCRQIISI